MATFLGLPLGLEAASVLPLSLRAPAAGQASSPGLVLAALSSLAVPSYSRPFPEARCRDLALPTRLLPDPGLAAVR